MGSGFAKKKKQAKMMQEQFAKMQEEMSAKEVTGTAGGGLISITLNGDGEMKKIAIKEDCVDPEDIEALEDLICAAHNDAQKKLRSSLPGLPGGGLPDMGALGF